MLVRKRKLERPVKKRAKTSEGKVGIARSLLMIISREPKKRR